MTEENVTETISDFNSKYYLSFLSIYKDTYWLRDNLLRDFPKSEKYYPRLKRDSIVF